MSTEKSESAKKNEDWMNAKWRPMMGWMYMVVCTCDFVLFPVLWSLMHAVLHTSSTGAQWQPLTLNGAGLFHIAMGAVLGIAAMGRTQEKLAGANNGGAPVPGTSPSFMPSFNNTPSAPAFGSAPRAPAPTFGAKPTGPGPSSFPAL